MDSDSPKADYDSEDIPFREEGDSDKEAETKSPQETNNAPSPHPSVSAEQVEKLYKELHEVVLARKKFEDFDTQRAWGDLATASPLWSKNP